MKLKFLAVAGLATLIASAHGAEKTDLKDQKEKVSYSFGMNMGNGLRQQDIEVDFDALFQGIKDAAAGKKTLLNEQEARTVMNEFRTAHRAKQEARRKELGEKAKAEGDKFLAENKSKPGVKTTASGLQYQVLSEGNGAIPKTNDTVTVNYRGTLIDGTEFDSSYKRGQPATFNLQFVVKGWTEALSMMKTGSKWKLFVPPALAYGERGSGNQIPPNATLIFEVELLGIKEPPKENPQPVTSDIIKVPSAEELKKGAKIEVIKPDQLPKEAQQPK
jgi:FKBP-type peptidyl-prolyl cis-trans isomerase FklB